MTSSSRHRREARNGRRSERGGHRGRAAGAASTAGVGRDALPGTGRGPAPRRRHRDGQSRRDALVDHPRAGSIPAKAQLETHVTAQELYEAAALPSQPLGKSLPERATAAELRPHGASRVVGVIAPFNVADDPRHPFGRTRRSRSATPWSSSPTRARRSRAASSFARIFEEAGLPAGVLQVLPGGPEVGEALVADPQVRVISFTGFDSGRPQGRRARRAAPQAGASRARRQLRADRARRCRRRAGRVRRRVRLVPPPGPDLHDDRPAPGAREGRRRIHRAAGRGGRACRSATRRATRSRSARSSMPRSATRFTSW